MRAPVPALGAFTLGTDSFWSMGLTLRTRERERERECVCVYRSPAFRVSALQYPIPPSPCLEGTHNQGRNMKTWISFPASKRLPAVLFAAPPPNYSFLWQQACPFFQPRVWRDPPPNFRQEGGGRAHTHPYTQACPYDRWRWDPPGGRITKQAAPLPPPQGGSARS